MDSFFVPEMFALTVNAASPNVTSFTPQQLFKANVQEITKLYMNQQIKLYSAQLDSVIQEPLKPHSAETKIAQHKSVRRRSACWSMMEVVSWT